jgi:OmpA-OmpF porin, OOP family
MKKIIVTAAWLVMGFALSLNAQEQKKPVANTFKPGWFIGANVGINTFLGEGNNFVTPNNLHYFSLIKNSSFLGRAELGYDFTSVVGVRGFLGFVNTSWPDMRLAQNTDGSYPAVKFGSENLTADLMINLSNWWAGYNPDRKIDISVFAGGGAGYLNNNVKYSNFAAIGRGGIQGDYHLSPVLDLNLIAEGNIASDNYNDLIVSPLPFDLFSAVTVGLTYRLPEAEKKPITTPVLQPETIAKKDTVKPTVKEPVVEPAAIAQTETKPVVVPDTIKPQKELPVVTPKAVLNGLNEKIFFTFNKASVENTKQTDALETIASFLKQHPEATITISGYADNSTGSVEANNEMSKQRAVNIANTLIRKYGVNIKRIRVMWYGGGIQPFRYAPKNRLVIVKSPFTYVAENSSPITSSVVAKAAGTAGKTKTAPAAVETDLFVTVHFTENKGEIENAKQEEAIEKAANFLKNNPDAVIVVSGYADKASGSAEANDALSKKRATNVANTLINKYSIGLDRIQVKWFGANKQISANPTMNRLVLIENIK